MTAQPGSIALITGAAKRLGKCMALALARAGWDIAIHYHHSQTEALETADEVRACGRRALLLQADLLSTEQTESLLPRCITQLGLPRCLINNASLFEFDRSEKLDPVLLSRHMTLNLTAPLLLSRDLFNAYQNTGPAHPALSQTPGIIINLLDQKLANLNPDFFSYTLSKAALDTATQLLARSYAPLLRVVGLAPGITLPSGSQTENDFAKSHVHTPLGHASYPEDIAQAVVYLVSAPAVTGTTLYVDGGQHLQSSPRDVMFDS